VESILEPICLPALINDCGRKSSNMLRESPNLTTASGWPWGGKMGLWESETKTKQKQVDGWNNRIKMASERVR